MNQVETIGLWIGLLSSVVGIVLAIVALWFTFAVDRRGQQVNTQMVKSLQKIESTVERSSGDTVDLIKVAWERLLGNVNTGPVVGADEEAIRAIAAGIAAELSADVEEISSQGDDDTDQPSGDASKAIPDLEREAARSREEVRKLERRLEQVLRSQRMSGQSSRDRLNGLFEMLERASPVSRAVVAELVTGGHLTLDQYRQLSTASPIRGDFRSLRETGLLVPLRGATETGEEEPVYWFPPTFSKNVGPVLQLVEEPREEAKARAIRALRNVGYPQTWLADRQKDDD